MKLTQDQVDFYSQNGYLKYGPILDAATLETLRREYDAEFSGPRARRLTEGDDKPQDGRAVLQIMQLCERNIEFRRLLYHADILDVLTDLMGPNIQLFHDQGLFKPPHTGGRIPWHQDNGYMKCSPASVISCWLTLDDVERDNGAMQVIPGSHLKAVYQKSSGLLMEVENVDESKAVVIDLPAGGCMFHHCQTLHYTAPNTTDRQRRAIAIHFMPTGTIADNKPMPVSFKHPLLRARI